MENLEIRYLKSLAKQFPNIAAASTEIINLQAIMNLPKGTEHFLTDIHGEWEQFNHVMKNGSGSVRRKIDEEFGNTLSEKDKRALATLIYYPKEKLAIVEEEDQGFFKVHQIKGKKSSSKGFCICYRGAHNRKGRAGRQGSIL